MTGDRLLRLRQIVIGQLESFQRAGVLELPRPPQVGQGTRQGGEIEQTARAPADTSPTAEADAPPAATMEASIPMPKLTGRTTAPGTFFESPDVPPRTISSASTLEILRQEVACCTRCDELTRTRTQTVFGVGNPNARLCFLGEAPGADEDHLGEPFVGRGGQLLNKIIEACKLKREEVYICNVLKCRPPGNRNPAAEEAANCRHFLDRQLELVRPEFICCLGAVAAQNLLGTTISIGKLRGKLHTYRSAKVVCTYHPAYLLRNPAAKKDTWEDMKFLMREMGVEL